MSERYKELILLHSNDLHGNFLSENVDEKLLGGISMLSGYVSEVKVKNPHALYCIAGDMLQGSLIDSEFKGLSTIEIMNMLNPDIVSLGNHEIDYGLAHLLFLERCAKFPIVCANIFIKKYNKRLFKSHKIINVNGMKVMFIGIITREIMNILLLDKLLGTLIDVEEAALEVGRICDAYRSVDIDFTVLLTHIGFEEDKRLAALLNPDWGVDVIIGGHTHTILDKPEEVNGILITQAGVGTVQLGRFDIVVDTDLNCVENYTWQLVPIDDNHCPHDYQLEETILQYKNLVDEKYKRILCKFPRPLTHPNRYRETELGNLMSDALKNSLGLDLMLLASGSIRKEQLGSVFSYGDLVEMMPYDEQILLIKTSGAQLRRMLAYMLRDETLDSGHGEFYQLSHGFQITYNRRSRRFEQFEYQGRPLKDDDVLNTGLQEYHYKNFANFFGLPPEELEDGKGLIVATSLVHVLDEYFSAAYNLCAQVEGRLKIIP